VFGKKPPAFEPDIWNDGGYMQDHNNCYNYACDMQTNTFAQPGRAAGLTLPESFGMQCYFVARYAIVDGLLRIGPRERNPSPGCCHIVALVMATGEDYHWYRLDDSGTWSHKAGRTEARDTDESGNIINDPAHADRGNYTDFCGYFYVCDCDVTIE
jgi:hypothetical protein